MTCGMDWKKLAFFYSEMFSVTLSARYLGVLSDSLR